MKSVLFSAFLAITVIGIGCDTPENTTGTDTASPPPADTTMANDAVVDSTATMPTDTTTVPTPTDTTSLP